MNGFSRLVATALIVGTLAACGSAPPLPPEGSEPAPAPAPAAPVAMPDDSAPLPAAIQQGKSRWVPVRWGELPGYDDDALHEAWNAWLKSCERPAPTGGAVPAVEPTAVSSSALVSAPAPEGVPDDDDARTIVVSAYGDMGNIRTAMNRGAFDFVVKPIDFKDLEVTIEKTFKHVTELKKNAQSSEENNLLRMFVSPKLIDRFHAKSLFAPMTSGIATVAYIDVVRGRAHITPENVDELVRTLNANFEVIVPAVTGRGGIIEKFVGDAVLVIFQGEDHATRALDACMTLRTQLRSLATRAGKDSPFALGIRIGVATGIVASGEIGSKAYGRLDHSVLGDVPRAAAMLEHIAKKNQILIDDATWEAVQGSFDCNTVEVDVAPLAFKAHEVVRRIGGDPEPKDPQRQSHLNLSASALAAKAASTTSDTIITHDGDIPDVIATSLVASTADDPAVHGLQKKSRDSSPS